MNSVDLLHLQVLEYFREEIKNKLDEQEQPVYLWLDLKIREIQNREG